MKRSRKKVDRFPSYHGRDWDKKIGDLNDANFWKYGVANLVFLDRIGDSKLVLDVGCGTGGSALFLAERSQAECIVGVDLVRDMIVEARRKAVGKGLDEKACFFVCDGRYLPFKSACFEALVSRGDAFCFLVPLKRAVRELKRVMKPKGILVSEMDNRSDWKPGSTVSTGFRKMHDGRTAYVVETFSARRNHRAISYFLDPNRKISRDLLGDSQFQKDGFRACEYPLENINIETVETRQGLLTHWPTAKELQMLFKRCGFTNLHLIGDGLLMKLLLDRDRAIVDMMRSDAELFFEIEARLTRYVDPNKAPTMILQATAR